MIESSIVVRVLEGLHTRPAARMAKLAKGFESSLELVCRGVPANAKSSVKLMLLGVKEGEEIVLRADGVDESDAHAQLMQFLQQPSAGLEEDAPPSQPAAAAAATAVQPATDADPAAGEPNCFDGIPGSRGCAMGPAHVYLPRPLAATRHVIDAADIPAELGRFRDVLADFVRRSAQAADDGAASAQDRAILQALVDVAQDEEYVGAIIRGIEAQGDAAAVTLRVGEVLAASFEALTDDYMRARAEDIRGVTRQVAAGLLGQPLPDLSTIRAPCVLVAAELSAWEFAQVPVQHVCGLVCTGGSATSHVAIMARAHGIPAVLGVPLAPADLQCAQTLVVDGDRGRVTLNPDTAQRAHAEARMAAERAARAALSRYRDVEPRTRDGRLVEVMANLGALGEIGPARANGAMGVGLFRTELLFMQQRSLPTEDEQWGVYRELAQAFHPMPVIIRTLDIGGDKPVAGIDFPREENPFLGWRGVRMCLDRPDVFKPQLRALLRAATVGNLRVMIPMVSELEEVRRVRALIAACEAELRAEGRDWAPFELGIMVETPAAVLQADALAAEVAFFSIGTNDLTQYVMATDRANARIAALYRTEHPAVMRAVEMTCEAARRAGIWVGICGEAAADVELIPRFVAMGVSELSMSPASILAAKKRIGEL
jgi:phosphocarrier protein FPr